MISFKEFLNEMAIKAPRPIARAEKLLHYLYKKKNVRFNVLDNLLPYNPHPANSNEVGHLRLNMKIPHHLLTSPQGTVGFEQLMSKLKGTFETKHHPHDPEIPMVVWDHKSKKFVVDDGNHRANVARLTRTPLTAHVFFPAKSIPEHLKDRLPINVGENKKYKEWRF